MQAFTEKAIQVIQEIPSGKIMTYGQVAAYAGSPRGARQISRLLHSVSSKYNLPWHRIVNAQGKIVLQDEESRFTQRSLLQKEGVIVDGGGKIDVNRYRYNPYEQGGI